MKIVLSRYHRSSGWQPAPTPELDSENTLVMLFGGMPAEDVAAPLADLPAAYESARFMGCSTAGEILGDDFSDQGLVLAVVRFHHTRLRQVSAILSRMEDSCRVGTELARALQAPDLSGVFVLSPGLGVNGSRLVDGFNEVFQSRIPVTGGLAADGDRFERTWVLHDKKPSEHRVSAIGFYGDKLKFAHGSRGGWDMLGPEREVTRAEASVLYELDGQPALALYKKYLGDRAAGLPATGLLFPLALRQESNDCESRVRTILAIDEHDQSITFAGDIPVGGFVRLMHANFDRLVDGAAQASEHADLAAYDGESALLSIAISCVGRRLVLGQRVEEEIEAVLDGLPENVSQIGFYSYGELSPLSNGRCDLHNQTMTVTLLWEQ